MHLYVRTKPGTALANGKPQKSQFIAINLRQTRDNARQRVTTHYSIIYYTILYYYYYIYIYISKISFATIKTKSMATKDRAKGHATDNAIYHTNDHAEGHGNDYAKGHTRNHAIANLHIWCSAFVDGCDCSCLRWLWVFSHGRSARA